MIDGFRRLKQTEGILKQEVSGSVILFNMENGHYFAINDVGLRVWEMCDGTMSVSQVLAAVADEYDAPAAIITEDVLSLLDELWNERLVVEADSPA
jgi:coenzyme PQQ synthesis protein D (PqqD)